MFRVIMPSASSTLTIAAGCAVWLSSASAQAQLALEAKGEAKAETKAPETAASAEATSQKPKPEEPAAEPAAEAEAAAAEPEQPPPAPEPEEQPEKPPSQTPKAKQPKGRSASNPILAPGPLLPIDYGNKYTFYLHDDRILGIPNGSLIWRHHGLQMDYRKTGLALSGKGWIDSEYQNHDRGLATEDNTSSWDQRGRFILRATPTFSYGNWFLKAQGELMTRAQLNATGDNSVNAQDAFVKFGYWDRFDVTLGRFQTWQIYHKGLGLERYTNEELGADPTTRSYEVNRVYYREDDVGKVAVHGYPTKWLRFELAGAMGLKEGYKRVLGVRPAVIFDIDWLKVKAAAERREETNAAASNGMDDNQQKRVDVGFGVGIEGILFPYVEGGINGATGFTDYIDPNGVLNPKVTSDISSLGGFVNVRMGWASKYLSGLLVGGGTNYTEWINTDCGVLQAGGEAVCGESYHQQSYAVIQHDVFTRGAIKLVVGKADAEVRSSFTDGGVRAVNQSYFGRLRALMWF